MPHVNAVDKSHSADDISVLMGLTMLMCGVKLS